MSKLIENVFEKRKAHISGEDGDFQRITYYKYNNVKG